MKSKIKGYNDLYNINKSETAKFKYMVDFLLYHFDLELSITLKVRKSKGISCTFDIKYARNKLYCGYILTIYIPNVYTSVTYSINNTELVVTTIHEDMLIVLLEAIYTIQKPKIEFQKFVYNTYFDVESIIRELKIKMVFEDD